MPQLELDKKSSDAPNFDPNVEVDRGRISSNGGYIAEQFDKSQLNPPLAPYAQTYIGNHAPASDTNSASQPAPQAPQGDIHASQRK